MILRLKRQLAYLVLTMLALTLFFLFYTSNWSILLWDKKRQNTLEISQSTRNIDETSRRSGQFTFYTLFLSGHGGNPCFALGQP